MLRKDTIPGEPGQSCLNHQTVRQGGRRCLSVITITRRASNEMRQGAHESSGAIHTGATALPIPIGVAAIPQHGPPGPPDRLVALRSVPDADRGSGVLVRDASWVRAIPVRGDRRL